jgi:hypothetical protein
MTVSDKLESMWKEWAVVLTGVDELHESVKITKFGIDIRNQGLTNMKQESSIFHRGFRCYNRKAL